MKWNSNDKGFVPYWKRVTKVAVEFDTGEDKAIEAMECGIAQAETDFERERWA